MGLGDLFKKLKIKRIAGDTMEQASEAENLEQAKKIIIQTLKEHPEMRGELFSEIGKQIDENEETPNSLLDEVAVGITESNSIPNKIINREGVKDNMTDEGIISLIKDDNIDLKMQQTLAKNIDDTESKEEIDSLIEERIDKEQEAKRIEKQKEILTLLDKLYQKCGDVKDSDIIITLSDIPENQKTESVKKGINAVIAKQMACNYLDYGSIIFSKFNEILSAEDMLALNFTEKIKKELLRVRTNKSPTEILKLSDSFTESWREVLIEDICKEVANKYIDTGVWDIKTSEEMKNISQKEEEYIVKSINEKIKKKKKKNLSTEDKLKIKALIRGKINVNNIIEYADEIGLFENLNDLLEITDEETVKKVLNASNAFVMNRIKREKGRIKVTEDTKETETINDSDQVDTDEVEH